MGQYHPRMTSEELQEVDLPVHGMDCAECAAHVQKSLRQVDGVVTAQVLLGAERARLTVSRSVETAKLRQAIEQAGYRSPDESGDSGQNRRGANRKNGPVDFARTMLTVLGLVFAVVLLVVVAGEWLGLLDRVSARIPWWAGLAAVLAGGYPVFVNVVRNALRGRIISHALMTLGVIAACVVGEWITAAIVVLFMRTGEFAERFTTERSRDAVRGLEKLVPETATLLGTGGEETEVPITSLKPEDVILVRPGARIPADGTVVAGSGAIDQSTITGESLPVDVAEDASVYAATLLTTGSLRLRITAVGRESMYGKVIRLAEEAEANRGEVQRLADWFSSIYLPIVAAIALATYLIGRDPIATASVLVVACSCSFALATPIAMMASIGAAARHGLLIKGGKHIEEIPRASVLLIDKTGTVTTGRMKVHELLPEPGLTAEELLQVAAAVERDSEHPLGRAIVRAALQRSLEIPPASEFASHHGRGVEATVAGMTVRIGGAEGNVEAAQTSGATALSVTRGGALLGHILVADTLREDAAEAIEEVRSLGIRTIELLTGDSEAVARPLAERLGISYRAGLLPEDKIRIVREYQEAGRSVIMIGDGVNDTPALVQANVGIAMGAIGSDVAIEAAHVCLLEENWALVPQLLILSKRTMRIVRANIGFTTLYNLIGLSLAAIGILPPILAAAAQSLPDIGILANSSRLIRQKLHGSGS